MPNHKHHKEKLLLQQSVVFTLTILLVLWLVKSIEFTFFESLGHFGVYPRRLEGVVGIFTSPFIHGSFQHLVANSLSWLLMGIFFFFFYDRIAFKVMFWVYLLSGILVWVFARPSYHIGFSGVLFGIASFILISGFIRKNVSALVLSFSILILFGGMFYGILPTKEHISWESHFLGMASGLVLALFFRKQYAGVVDWRLRIESIEDLDEEPNEYIYEYIENNKDEPINQDKNNGYIIIIDKTKEDESFNLD